MRRNPKSIAANIRRRRASLAQPDKSIFRAQQPDIGDPSLVVIDLLEYAKPRARFGLN